MRFADNCQPIYFGFDEARDSNVGPEAYAVGIRAFDFNRKLFLAVSRQRSGRSNDPFIRRVKVDLEMLNEDIRSGRMGLK